MNLKVRQSDSVRLVTLSPSFLCSLLIWCHQYQTLKYKFPLNFSTPNLLKKGDYSPRIRTMFSLKSRKD